MHLGLCCLNGKLRQGWQHPNPRILHGRVPVIRPLPCCTCCRPACSTPLPRCLSLPPCAWHMQRREPAGMLLVVEVTAAGRGHGTPRASRLLVLLMAASRALPLVPSSPHTSQRSIQPGLAIIRGLWGGPLGALPLLQVHQRTHTAPVSPAAMRACMRTVWPRAALLGPVTLHGVWDLSQAAGL